MTEVNANWPDDLDGAVLRRLAAENFDFARLHRVDYNVDFGIWPPPPAALDWLRSQFGAIELCPPNERGAGYVLLRVKDRVTYESVTAIQRRVSAAMKVYGGVCESWGVMH